MFEYVIFAAIIGVMAGFAVCLLQKETYDAELVEWDVLD